MKKISDLTKSQLITELEKQTEVIHGIRRELQETNQGILCLIMDLELAADEKLKQSLQTIQYLQKEIDVTDQGVLTLTVELEQAREKYQNILENARESILIFDDNLLIESFNPATKNLFDYTEEELQLMHLSRLIPDFDSLYKKYCESDDKSSQFEHGTTILTGITKTGKRFPIELTVGTPFLSNKKLWLTIVRDITERIKAEQSLRLMAKIFEGTQEGIMIIDIEKNIIDVNNSFEKITGYPKQEIIGLTSDILNFSFHEEDFYSLIFEEVNSAGKWEGEVSGKKKEGSIFPMWLSISPVLGDNDKVTHYVSLFRDISKWKEDEKKLKALAHYDQLTGLPNRVSFIDKLQYAIAYSERNYYTTALFFLDLDRFKLVNDTLGHAVGDQVLIEVAQRLKFTLRKTDIISRFAGDEFTIVITQINYPDAISAVAKKILNSIAEPIYINDREIILTASIGITVIPNDGTNINILLKNADLAMYYAKKLGKNQFAYFSTKLLDSSEDELALNTNLRKALHNKEFLLYFQPQISVETGEIIGVEALIRWQHPTIGMVPPLRFIPYAEKSDLILPIGTWVLQEACLCYKEWKRKGIGPIKISVNYSGVQLKQSDQIKQLANILSEFDMDPNFLCLELTESVAMEDVESTIRVLREFKKMGVSISIDDFGTGYSSLNYLKMLPIDSLKIDKSFVKDLSTDKNDLKISSIITSMAHNLGLSVVAEGVETQQQYEILKDMGCNQIQGYYFARPLPKKEFEEFYHSWLPKA